MPLPGCLSFPAILDMLLMVVSFWLLEVSGSKVLKIKALPALSTLN